MQLGRSMKAFNIWLSLKYFGLDLYKKEYERLLTLAKDFKSIIDNDDEFELVGPSESIIVCFRWEKNSSFFNQDYFNRKNDRIRMALVKEGISFLNGVSINNKTALRACFSNFNTKIEDLTKLLTTIKELATSI